MRRRPGTVDRLDPAVRAEVDAALERGKHLDEIIAHLRVLGVEEVSRSGLGRYSQRMARFAADRDRTNAIVQGMGLNPDDTDANTRLLVQLLQSLVSRFSAALLGDDDGELAETTALDLKLLTDAVRNLASAQKIDLDTKLRIKAETRREALEQAATAGEKAARSAGATPETLARIRAEILGLAA